jgi:Xaa-Pro aminopeptidase
MGVEMIGKSSGNFLESVSTKELERRWEAVRSAMKEKNLDFLIARNGSDILGGYVKWLSNIGAKNDYPVTVIFPREDDMTIIKHGSRGSVNPGLPGIKKQINVPMLPSLQYSITYDAETVAEELGKYKGTQIGLVGMGFIPAAFFNYINIHLNTATFSDAAELVDNIKAVKSDEEIQHLRALAEAQDNTAEYILTRIQPGKQNFEIYADMMHHCLLTGSTTANLMVNSEPSAGARQRGGRNRIIQEGDLVHILLESNGPSGYFTEITFIVSLGKVPQLLQEHYGFAQEIQRKTLKLFKPGANSQDIWKDYNELLKKDGFAEEKRIGAHGMGYDMVERPCLQLDETMIIRAGMNIAAHATVVSDRGSAGVCENYIIQKSGEPQCLHKTQQKIIIL